MMKSQAGIAFTVEEKVLLYLADFKKYEGYWEAPSEVTQEGIANSIGIGLNNVPRTVKKLQKKDFLTETTMHVFGAKRRKKTYFLTPKGYAEVAKIIEKISNVKIPVKTKDGIKNVLFKNVNSTFEGKLTPFKILTILDKKGFVEYVEEVKPSAEEFQDSFTNRVSKPTYFVNREKELEDLNEKINTHKVIFLIGATGIGKSTLLAKFLESYVGKRHILWIEIKKWTTLEEVLSDMSNFLLHIDRAKLHLYMRAAKKTYNLLEVRKLLLEDLEKLNLILIIDALHNAKNTDLHSFFNILIHVLEKVENVRLFFTARKKYDFYSREDVAKNLVCEYNIPPLTEDSAKELLHRRNVKMENVKNFKILYQLSEGNPSILNSLSQQDVEKILKLGKKDEDFFYLQMKYKQKLAE